VTDSSQVRPRVRAFVPHVRSPPFRANNGEFGRLLASLQRDPVLGGYRDLHDHQSEQTRRPPEKIHKTGGVVSTVQHVRFHQRTNKYSSCKEYQNLNAFCAIVMGLSNVAVSRLSLTWEKLPSKFRKLYTEFESLIDPSRNHRAYRVSVGKLQPPVVPFMPLLLKDMTFTHEGNKTSLDGLVNFEKMHMLAQTMRTIRFCRSRHLGEWWIVGACARKLCPERGKDGLTVLILILLTVLEPPSPKSEGEVKSYISCLRVIDNQRVLTSMSQKLEPRRS
jgi:hypothetical protein